MHVFERAEGREHQADSDHDEVRTPGAPDQRTDEPRQGAGGIEKREGAAHEEDGEDHVRAGDDPARHRKQRGRRPYRRRVDARVGSTDHHLPPGGRIGSALVAPRREHPGQEGGDRDAAEEEDQRVREAESHLTAPIVPPGPGRR